MKRAFLLLAAIFCSVNSYTQNLIEDWSTSNTASLYDVSGSLKSSSINSFELVDIYMTPTRAYCYSQYNSNYWVEYAFNQKSSTYFQTTEFNTSVDVQIEYWTGSISGPSAGTYTTKLELSRKNNDENKNQFISYFILPNSSNYTKVKATILSGSTAPTNLINLFSLKVGFNAKYYKTVNFAGGLSFLSPQLPATIPSSASGIKIEWLSPNNACQMSCDEYDFEWTHLDYYGSGDLIAPYLSGGIYTNSDNPFSKLKYSRMTTKTPSISHFPLVYPKGYIIFRIREVFYDQFGSRREGDWFYYGTQRVSPGSNTWTTRSFFLTIDGHESKLNWTNNLSFAENATHKSVLTYFDGSQRDRQSVTFNISDSVPVIAETFYDKEGRKAASILPSPELTDKTIKFYRNYNLSKVTGLPYDFEDFNNMQSCWDLPNILDTNSGAAKYYSTNNILKNSSFNSFIPNASGYPLTTMEYTNDNEGRIKRQSGVGRDFQFGSGKETRYMYGKASRDEIDRLFGTDVGYNSHYFKNAVIDPNGQVSVTYLDMAGRTIATSLAGDAANTTIINSANNTGNAPINFNLLESRDFVKDIENVSSYANANHIVTGTQTMKFYAKANQVDYIDTCKNVTCADCYFDMNIKVKSKCVPYAEDMDTTYRNYTTIPPIDISCTQKLPVINDSFSLSMPTGEYYVSADVTIPPKVIDFYTKKYLEDGACFPDLDSLIRKYKARGAPCIRTCEQCKEMYDDTLATINNMMAQLKKDGQKFIDAQDSIAVRNSLAKFATASKHGCAAYCDKLLPCDIQRQILLGDVSPGGQYAMWFDTTNMKAYKDSAFDSKEIVGKPRPQWKMHNDGTTVYTQANFNAQNIKRLNGENFNFSTPQGLRQLADEWDESFATKLIQYHPEYCYLQYCVTNEDHHDYFDELNKIETWAEAVQKGYLPSSLSGNNFKFSSDNLVNGDPYFSNSSRDGFGIKTTFSDGLRGLFFRDIQNNNWSISIFDLAMIYANPRLWKYDVSYSGTNIVNVVHKFDYNYLDTCDCGGLKDIVWVQFRNLYQKIATYKYDELRDAVGCPDIKPKKIGILNADLQANNPYILFFQATGRQLPVIPMYYYKTPRFYNTWDIYNNFQSRINDLVKDPNTGKYRTKKDLQDDAKYKLKRRCDSICESQSYGWVDALKHCVWDTENLRKDLITVCQSSCGDNRYGFGTKTTPYNNKIYIPGKKKMVTSFQEVIDLYTNSSPQDIYCSAEYIYHPPNWGEDYAQYIEEDVMYTRSTCVCKRIDTLIKTSVLDLSPSSNDVALLHADLLSKFGPMDFNSSIEDLRVMLKLCRKTDTICIYPDKMVKIPNIFTCHNFTSCKELNRAHKQFKALYPDQMIDGYDGFDYENFERAKFKKLYTGFMNRQLKMNLSFEEILKHVGTCEGCDTIDCDFWKKKFFEFLELKKNFPKRVAEKISNDPSTFVQYWWYVKKMNYLSSMSTSYTNFDTFKVKILDTCIAPCSNVNKCFDDFLVYVQSIYPGISTTPPYDIEFLAAMAGYMNFCMYGYSQNLTISDYTEMLEKCRGPMPATISCNQLRFLLDGFNKTIKPPINVNDPNDIIRFKEWIKSKLGAGQSIDGINFTTLFSNCLACEIDCEDLKAAVAAVNSTHGRTPVKPSEPSGDIGDVEVKLRLNPKYTNCIFRPGQIQAAFTSGCFPCNVTCENFLELWKAVNNADPNGPIPPAPKTIIDANGNVIFDNPQSIPADPFKPGVKGSPPRFYSEKELLDIFKNAGHNSSAFSGCILSEEQLLYWAWKIRLRMQRNCPSPCSEEECPPPTGGGGGEDPPPPCKCIIGTEWCCSNPPPCCKTGLESCCGENPPPPLNCCDRFKLFWNGFYHNKNVFNTPIDEDKLGTILSDIRAWYNLFNMQKGFTGCEEFWDDKALLKLIEDCLKKKVVIKGKEDEEHDPGGGGNGEGPGNPGGGQGGSGNGNGTGGGCCQLRSPMPSSAWSLPIASTVDIEGEESSIAFTGIHLSAMDWTNVSNNFTAPYTYKEILCSAAPVALPPPTYPHRFDSLNLTACDKLIFDKPIAPRQEVEDSSCEKQMRNLAIASAMREYDILRQQATQDFQFQYINKCLSFANASLTAKGVANEFHFTLYYYGQDGNLLRTVPPAGTNPIASASLPNVVSGRNNVIPYLPNHTLPTDYKYNSLNQVFEQSTPDAGTSRFVYDQLGRLILSQNAEQAIVNNGMKKYSYTIYDAQSRIVESGEMALPNAQCTTFDGYFTTNYTNYNTYVSNIATLKPSSTMRYVTRTYYDVTKFPAVYSEFNYGQQRLRKRIASITLDTLDMDKGADSSTYHTALHYSYDVLGNVSELVSENRTMSIANQRYKKVEYDYDLVSGKVNQVHYQKGKADQFFHKYFYDAENRITKVKTSRDEIHWDRDAEYEYYLHGPLARTKLGEQDIQGLDYAYTLQGWLKSVNASTLHQAYDMGRDGDPSLSNNINVNTARDALAFSLRYFNNDYKQIAKYNQTVEAALPSGMNALNLYNGNITSQTVSIKGLTQPTLSYQYRYDQLNRFVKMDAYESAGAITNNDLTAAAISTKYGEQVGYDPNGNIQSYKRRNETGAMMDQLTYNYDAVKKNQLKQVNDAVGNTVSDKDIDNQIHSDNYQYDAIGNLIKDRSENMDISWTPTGKIASIVQNTKNLKIVFGYDPMGNRITKSVYKPITAAVPSMTYYTRDAQGNTMAVYDNKQEIKQWITCSYDQGQVFSFTQNIYNIFYVGMMPNYLYDPNLTEHEAKNFRDGLMNSSVDTCDKLMRTWLLGQIFQIPNTQIQVLNDPNVLRLIYIEVENRYGVDSKAIILNDLQNMFPGEDPAVIEAWLDFIYKLKASGNTDYYPDLVNQNFGYMLDTTKNYTDSLYWREQHLYGSSRLGMHHPDKEIVHADPSYLGLAKSLYTGMRQYELTNHLGNVLSTIKDEKKQIANTAGTLVSYYEPIVYSASDYYPFGMPMPNRQYSLRSGSKYRFGFNGKENDLEVDGQQDYGLRIYDNRLGRFKSVDPLSNKFPWYSPYHFAGNSPIRNTDLDGGEPQDFMETWDKETNSANEDSRTRVYTFYDVKTDMYYSVKERTTPTGASEYFWAAKKGVNANGETAGVAGTSAPVGTEHYNGREAVWQQFTPNSSVKANQEALYKIADFGQKAMLGTSMAAVVIPAAAAAGLFTAETCLATQLGSAASDLTAQLTWNGGNFSEVNWISVGANGYFANPFTSSLIGASMDLSVKDGFSVQTSAGDLIYETAIGTAGNLVGDKITGHMIGAELKGLGKGMGVWATNQFGDQPSSGANFVKDYVKDVYNNDKNSFGR